MGEVAATTEETWWVAECSNGHTKVHSLRFDYSFCRFKCGGLVTWKQRGASADRRQTDRRQGRQGGEGNAV